MLLRLPQRRAFLCLPQTKTLLHLLRGTYVLLPNRGNLLKYDLDYYENMLREYSKTAEEISSVRWDWIKETNPKVVLDYGSGVSWFRAWRPKGVEVYSYDIAKYPQTGIKLITYDVICFWDVLEHIRDFDEIEPVLRLSRNVALSLPLVKEENLAAWKHFKPGEHLHYFTEKTLNALFEKYGFMQVRIGQPECPPRKDITSVLYKECRWKS